MSTKIQNVVYRVILERRNFCELREFEFFNSHAWLQQLTSGLLKITGPNVFAPYFSVSALIIKHFGRLFSA